MTWFLVRTSQPFRACDDMIGERDGSGGLFGDDKKKKKQESTLRHLGEVLVFFALIVQPHGVNFISVESSLESRI